MQKSSTAIYVPANWLVPLDWREVFWNEQPVELDIGCGKGNFLLWSAQANPGANFVGVERLLRRVRRIDRKVQRLGLQNVRLLRVEAGYLVGYLVPAASVTAYHIYFPDPWPKRRHHSRRLMSPAFVSNLLRTLRDDGTVNFATDHEEYFRQMQEVFGETTGFSEVAPEILPEEAQTDFEREFLAMGRPVYRCRWAKKRAEARSA